MFSYKNKENKINSKIVAFVLGFLMIGTSVIQAQKETYKKKSEASKATESERTTGYSKNKEDDEPREFVTDTNSPYLTEARENTIIYLDKGKHDIRRFNVLVSNYGDAVPGSSQIFTDIKANYRRILLGFHQRDFLNVFKKVKENRKKSYTLYSLFSAKYKEQVDELLTLSTEKLVDQEMVLIIERGQKDQRGERAYLENEKTSHRVRLAYANNNEATEMTYRGIPLYAIEHYRISKTYCVEALKNMEKGDDAQKKIEDKYRRELLDSRGFIVR